MEVKQGVLMRELGAVKKFYEFFETRDKLLLYEALKIALESENNPAIAKKISDLLEM